MRAKVEEMTNELRAMAHWRDQAKTKEEHDERAAIVKEYTVNLLQAQWHLEDKEWLQSKIARIQEHRTHPHAKWGEVFDEQDRPRASCPRNGRRSSHAAGKG